MNTFSDEYFKYFTSKQFTRLSLFEKLREQYGINKALYLGSFIHVTPSLVFPEVVYVDTFKETEILNDKPAIEEFVNIKKQYLGSPKIKFIKKDYEEPLPIDHDFDLLISQYAGFVSQAGKQYLKLGGLLVANNSHGDASMANLDRDYQLIAVANHKNDTWRISTDGLGEYFIPKNGVADDKSILISSTRGFGYNKAASDYIFKKVK